MVSLEHGPVTFTEESMMVIDHESVSDDGMLTIFGMDISNVREHVKSENLLPEIYLQTPMTKAAISESDSIGMTLRPFSNIFALPDGDGFEIEDFDGNLLKQGKLAEAFPGDKPLSNNWLRIAASQDLECPIFSNRNMG